MSPAAEVPALSVRCPHCWAPAGTPCSGQTVERAEAGEGFHEGRHRAAEMAGQARAGFDKLPGQRTDPDREPWHPTDLSPQPLAEYSADVMGENMGRHAGYVHVVVKAGPRPPERIVPPAGEEYAFDAVRWARRVEVLVSPTGRSARVWVDGVEIPPPG